MRAPSGSNQRASALGSSVPRSRKGYTADWVTFHHHCIGWSQDLRQWVTQREHSWRDETTNTVFTALCFSNKSDAIVQFCSKLNVQRFNSVHT